MSIKTLPPTLLEAHALIEQLQWRVGQLADCVKKRLALETP